MCDRDLPPEKKYSWAGKWVSNDIKAIEDVEAAIAWMNDAEMELISAETHTLWRMNFDKNREKKLSGYIFMKVEIPTWQYLSIPLL